MSSLNHAESSFEKHPVFHYQTDLGKTFTAMPDAENIGLNELRKNELAQIEQFINDEHSKILVIGGFSATGKTYLFKKFAKTNNYAYADWHMYGQFLIQQDTKSIIERIQTKNSSAKNTLLIMDENIAPISRDEDQTKEFKKTIKELLQRYSKLILLGGGSKYTSDEQTSLISEQLDFLPTNEISTMPFKFKPLNLKQSTQFMEIVSTQLIKRLSTYQTDNKQQGNNLFKENKKEHLQKIATAIPPQFRTSRILNHTISKFTLLKPSHASTIDSTIDELRGNTKLNSYIPEKDFESLWEKTKEKLKPIALSLLKQ